MSKILAFVFLLSGFGIAVNYQKPSTTKTVQKCDNTKITNESFDVNFQVEKINEEEFTLVVGIELDKPSYIISPHSEDGFYGKLDVSIKNTDYLQMHEMIVEIPNSIPEIDPIINKPVRFIRENTRFKRKIRIKKQTDFDASGLVWFLLEPSCIPYKVEFNISYDEGVIEVKKTGTRISEEYKG